MFGRKKACTFEKYLEIKLKIEQDSASEDRLYDEYCELGRPRIPTMVRLTETSKPELMDLVDLEDFKKWRDNEYLRKLTEE